ncbi:hypothetical protein KPH14_007240 [Odynerus spinipes]|uniref:MADF domain-containing protein n=1 Tax=Odynerus spinipes TaxID=1348599 RepID=A0AAD9VIG3_9HYME|nr:hypothetical protein KPH14_007240 [Odynerus spinipes]
MANDTIVKFIELYRSCECLWNVSSEDYGSRLSRNAAYGTISRKMRIPGFGPREVARKIKNLRSAYQQEVKRIETTEQNHGTAMGTIHRPRAVWFDLLDEFLRNSEKPSQSDRQSDNQQSEAASKVLSNDEREKNVTNSPRNLSPCESSSHEIGSDRCSRKRRPCVADDFRRVVGEERRKRRKEEEDAIEVEEYDSFGKYVAASLSRMPFEYAVSAETEIHSVIIKYKILETSQALLFKDFNDIRNS